MYFLIHLTIFLWAKGIKANDVETVPIHILNLTVQDISDRLLTLFPLDEKGRIKDLKQKLAVIKQYVIDHNIVAEVLSNVTSETRLNETNFYEALRENDHFRYLSSNDSKNLYLKLKERMTRDDVLQIVAERGKRSKLVKSARRMMTHKLPEEDDEEMMNDVVDKLLAETPNDKHKAKAKESIYWDPQGELEELKAYHESKRSGRRIFRGERTTIRYYPFMASVHLMGRFWCGAVIYWHDLCITSASCLQLMHNNRFFRENPRVLQVRVGSNHSRIGGEMIDVLEVYFHPGYNPKTLKCNVAVIRLRRHLHMSYHRVAKVLAISHMENTPPPTAEVLLLGWGVTKISQKLSYEPIFLQRKILPVYPNAFCKEVYGDKFISETMFCAGTLTTGEGACDHDAGGPAILSGKLVGIISFGPSICGFADAPTVFTHIGSFADWIESVNETMPEYYRGRVRTTTTTQSALNEFLATYKVSGRHKPKLLDPLVMAQSGETAAAETLTTITEETTPATEADTTGATEATETTVTPRETEATTAAYLREGYESDGGWSIDLN